MNLFASTDRTVFIFSFLMLGFLVTTLMMLKFGDAMESSLAQDPVQVQDQKDNSHVEVHNGQVAGAIDELFPEE